MGMEELGIAGGFGQGLQSAVSTYLQTQNMLQEQAIKKRLANAQSIDAWSKSLHEGGSDMADTAAGFLGIPNAAGGVDQSPGGAQTSAQNSSQHMVPNAGGGLVDDSNDHGAQPSNPMAALAASNKDSLKFGAGPARDAVAKAGADTYLNASDPTVKQGIQNDLSGRYQSEDPIKNMNAAMAPAQKLFNTNPKSPTAVNTALFSLMAMERPNQAATESNFNELAKSGGWSQQLADLIEKKVHGTLTPASFNDIQRTGLATTQALIDNARRTQNDYSDKAKQRGVDPSFVIKNSNLDQLQSLVAKKSKQLGPAYESTLDNAVASSPQAQGVLDTIKSGGQGLVNGFKGLVSNFSTGNSGSSAQMSPPKGDMVSVTSPEGKHGSIPKSQLKVALGRGFKVNGQ